MKTFLKVLFVSALLLTAMPVWAVLPETVERACFSLEFADTQSQKRWAVTSWEKWRDVTGLTLQMEADGSYVATLAGTPHVDAFYTTSVTLSSPAVTTNQPQPLQTLTFKVMAASFVGQSSISVYLINDVVLPPFSIELCGQRMVMVAKDKTWYIVIDDKNARIHQAKENPCRVTVETTPLTIDSSTRQGEVKLYIGEGVFTPDRLNTLK